MKLLDDATWAEPNEPVASGRLKLGRHSILLHSPGDDALVERELAFEEIAAVEILPGGSRPTVVLHSRSGVEVELASPDGAWSLGDLLEDVLIRRVRGDRGGKRILAALPLKPGSRARALELLAAVPQLEPATLTLRDAFLLDDEMLFLFAAHGGEELELLGEADSWLAQAGWHALSVGELRVAEQAYAASTAERAASPIGHLGLGL